MNLRVPSTVFLPVALLLPSVAVGFWRMVEFSRTLEGVPLWMPYSAIAVQYAVLLAWLMLILLGKRWARTTYAVMGVLGLVALFPHLAELRPLDWALTSSKLVALLLLYLPANDAWFGARGAHRGGAALSDEGGG